MIKIVKSKMLANAEKTLLDIFDILLKNGMSERDILENEEYKSILNIVCDLYELETNPTYIIEKNNQFF